jgi:hypothetical protein
MDDHLERTLLVWLSDPEWVKARQAVHVWDEDDRYALPIRRAVLPVPHVGSGARWTLAYVVAFRGRYVIGAGLEDCFTAYPVHVTLGPFGLGL